METKLLALFLIVFLFSIPQVLAQQCNNNNSCDFDYSSIPEGETANFGGTTVSISQITNSTTAAITVNSVQHTVSEGSSYDVNGVGINVIEVDDVIRIVSLEVGENSITCPADCSQTPSKGIFVLDTSTNQYQTPDVVCYKNSSQFSNGCVASYIKRTPSGQMDVYAVVFDESSSYGTSQISNSGTSLINKIDFDGDGTFYILWQEGSPSNIKGVMINPNQGTEIAITSDQLNSQNTPDITSTGPNFPVVWFDASITGLVFGTLDKTPSISTHQSISLPEYSDTSIKHDKSSSLTLLVYYKNEDIYATAFGSSGNIAIQETKIADNPSGALTFTQRLSEGSENSGKFLLTWTNNNTLYGKLVKISGSQITSKPQFTIYSGATSGATSAYETDSDTFLIAWGTTNSIQYKIVKLDSNGNPTTIKDTDTLANDAADPVSTDLNFAEGFGVLYASGGTTNPSLRLKTMYPNGTFEDLSVLAQSPPQTTPGTKQARIGGAIIDSQTTDNTSFKVAVTYVENSTNRVIPDGSCQATLGSPINKTENLTFSTIVAGGTYKTSTLDVINTTTFTFNVTCSQANYTTETYSTSLTVTISPKPEMTLTQTTPTNGLPLTNTNNVTLSGTVGGAPEKAELWTDTSGSWRKTQEKTVIVNSISFQLNGLQNGTYKWNLRLVRGSEEKWGENRTFTVSYSEPAQITCNESDCGDWGECMPNNQQWRVCTGPTASICAAQDKTVRSCVYTPKTQQLCSPGTLQCSGTQSQVCSQDGQNWTIQENCKNSCNTTSGRCNIPPPPASSDITPIIVVIAIIIVAILAILFYMGKLPFFRHREDEETLYSEEDEGYSEEGYDEENQEEYDEDEKEK